MKTKENIVSDEQIELVHGNCKIGSMSKRRFVDQGVLQSSAGFATSMTLMTIPHEHGLIAKSDRNHSGNVLTSKGRKYLRALLYNSKSTSEILDFVYPQEQPK